MPSFRYVSRTKVPVHAVRCGVLGLMATVLSTGCISGSLATSTGSRPEGFAWSPDPKQYAHIGEHVSFDFVLTDAFDHFVDPVGIIDYGVATMAGERIEMEVNPSGHLTFTRPINADIGESLHVEVTAYRQLAGRDQIKVGDEWLRSNSPFEQPDKRVASDSVTLLIYQAHVRLRLASPPSDLDPETGVMRLQSDKGSAIPIYIDRPGRPGFRITGPDADAYYTVTYDPPGNVLNDHGSTKVEFTIYDLSGQRHEVSDEIDTP